MQLTIKSGPGAGRTVKVEGTEFTIGREAGVDLVLTDGKASRRHAALRVLPDGRATLYDLGSSNGTFANVRLRNQLAPGTAGGFTVHLPDGEETTIFDAAMKYADEGVPLGVLAGKEYGSGSSRDWAAKGPRLLGVRFVIAESYERIHRSNLVGMGVLPLQFAEGQNVESLGLTGKERFDLAELSDGDRTLTVTATPDDGESIEFEATVRIDTPNEWLYYRHGGILHYVLRQLLAR